MAKFSGGDEVRDRRNGEVGVVLKTEPAGGTILCRIQFGTQFRYVSEGHLEPAIQDPLDALRARTLGDPAAFSLRMRALLLEHAYRTDRYSGLTNARIELKPHQVAVATRVLDKVRPRMLLADEVGLGKTIEAGLIIKELLAREVIERILVVTPASLVHQWHYELRNKFNEEFTILDSSVLRRSRQRGAKNPFDEHDKVLCSSHFARTTAADLLRVTEWGLVVVDEAHHLAPRPDPNKLYRLVEALGPRAFGMLLLTATPIQLRAKELYDLIELVEPGTFRDVNDFEERRTEIPKLNALWKELEDWTLLTPAQQTTVLDEHHVQLQGALRRSWGGPRAALASEGRRKAVQQALTARHPYLDVMVRNRRRVLNIGVRRVANLVRCTPSELEAAIYEEVVEYLRDQYDLAVGAKNNARGFLMVTYLKILSSSTWALAQSFRRRVERLTAGGARAKGSQGDGKTLVETVREAEDSSLAIEEVDAEVGPAEQEVEILRVLIRRLDLVDDAKTDHLLELLDEVFAAAPDEKVLIFTQFLATQDLLRGKLRDRYRVYIFNGRMTVEEKDHAVESFRERGQILISTESGGEGRNFQFCHRLVNYDLPWNPMRVEQRIGRLDRIGQRSDSITIWNLVAEGTVEERVESVLRERIRVFEESIGELDPILEDDLEKAAFARPDRRDKDFEQVGDQAERRMLELRRTEQRLEDFISDHELRYRREDSARVLQGREQGLLPQLREIVSTQLDTIGGSLDPHAEGGEVIAFSPLTAQRLGRSGQRRARGTFSAEEAIRLEEIDLFAFGHPLIDQLLRDAVALRDDRLAIAYETDGDRPFEGVEVWYRLRVTRAGDHKWLADKYLVARAIPGGPATITLLSALDQRRLRPADPDSFGVLTDSGALDEAISACQAAALQALVEFESGEQEASQQRVKRELDREQRMHANRLAAATHTLTRAQEQRAEIERSTDTRAQRILPALRGQVEAAQQRIRDLEQEYRHTVEQLHRRGEVVTDHEVIGATLVRVVPR